MTRVVLTLKRAGEWTRAHVMILPITVLALFLLAPVAKASVADIIALLQGITSTLQGDIGLTLSTAQQLNVDTAKFHQQLIWPVSSLNQVKSFINISEQRLSPLLRQMQLSSLKSATLPSPAAFENALRSADVTNVGQTSINFRTVYGPVPSASAAQDADRNMMDMDDASAQSSMKVSIVSDQTAARMLSVADSIAQQAANAAPGSAPMLAAQAQIATLENHAIMAKALAAELRAEATKLAHENALLKRSAEHTANLQQKMQQIMSHP